MTAPPSSVPSIEPPADLPAGTLFQDRYEIVRCLGRGGMGAVYEVIHRMTDRRRALKIMLPGLAASPEARRRFEREAKITAGIDSNHIAEVLDAGVDVATASPYFVMELLRGRELGELLADRKALVPAEAIVILSQAALGLDKAHKQGIVHRDLKPENIFVSLTDDGAPRVKLLDFGIAKVLDSPARAALTQGVMGTPRYIAPEQVSGSSRIGPAADRYALALVAYTCLVDEEYFAEEIERADGVMQMLAGVMTGPGEDAVVRARRRTGAQLPAGFAHWFAKAAHVNADKRFDSAVESMHALASVLDVPTEAGRSVHMGASTLIEALGVPVPTPAKRAPEPSSGAADDSGPTLLAQQDIAIDAGATIVASSAAVPPPPPTRRRRPRAFPMWGIGLATAVVAMLAFVALNRSAKSASTTTEGHGPGAYDPQPLETASALPSAQPLVSVFPSGADSAAPDAAIEATAASAPIAAAKRLPLPRGAARAKPSASSSTFNLPTINR